MTSLPDRPNTALLVIDMQAGVVANAHDVERVVGNINALVDRARSEEVPVIWVQHSDDGLPQGSDEWQYVDELAQGDDEPVVHKRYGDSFEETDLEALLAERHVGRLVVTGAQTDACIRATIHGALVRGYDTVLVEDAHTTEDLREWGAPFGPGDAIAYTNLSWNFASAPGRSGSTAPTATVELRAQ
jgi:nicotinamidase-related amidase